jgi:hypothetical protein
VLRFNRRCAIVFVLICLILALLEIYAHNYVQLHILSVIPENEAISSFPYGENTGTFTFSSVGCRWLVVWKADRASPSINYGYICIFKVGQNKSLFTLNVDLVVLKLEPKSNNTRWFSAELDEVLYESNRITVRIKYYFGEVNTYEIDFGLVVQVYEETLFATLLKEVRIPMKTVISYRP